MQEKSLVLIKPDGVQRGLAGEIISRFEKAGLKLVAMKMVQPTHDIVDKHYALTEEWMMAVYTKAKAKYEANGQPFNFPDHISYGSDIKRGLVDLLEAAPVIAMVLEGEAAVSLIRKLVGATEPASSAPGTIRGDLALDTYSLANQQNRAVRNLIHASGTVEEAATEVKLWFTDKEIYAYEGANDRIQYDAKWFTPKQ